jgi:uncharacterized protein (DUF2147 family)
MIAPSGRLARPSIRSRSQAWRDLIRSTGLLGLAILSLSVDVAAALPPPTGLWLTQDHSGVIAIANCGDRLCGRIVGVFLDRPDDRTPVDYRGVSQCGLPLITDARQIRAGLWKGHITDPRNGDVWGAEFHLDRHGNLALRGFLGVPLLGRTEIWTRYLGKLPSDCRIIVGERQVQALTTPTR